MDTLTRKSLINDILKIKEIQKILENIQKETLESKKENLISTFEKTFCSMVSIQLQKWYIFNNFVIEIYLSAITKNALKINNFDAYKMILKINLIKENKIGVKLRVDSNN